MTVTLPQVTKETINSVVKPVLKFEELNVDKEQLILYLKEIQEANPEIVVFIERTAQMMDILQATQLDCGWFSTVSMILMYKALEQEYAKLT